MPSEGPPPSERPVRVALADDHNLFRQGTRKIIEEHARFEVVGEATNGHEAVALVRETKPDILLVDYSMPELDGPGVAAQVRKMGGKTRVVGLSMHDKVHYVMAMLDAGACGFIVKTAEADELIEALDNVYRGLGHISPSLTPYLANQLSRADTRSSKKELSEREFELLRYLGAGLAIRECADKMSVGVSTASTYRARLKTKLKLSSTAELIRYAIENGIVD